MLVLLSVRPALVQEPLVLALRAALVRLIGLGLSLDPGLVIGPEVEVLDRLLLLLPHSLEARSLH